MAGVESYEPGDVFTVRTYKRKTTNPDAVWSNTYELCAIAGGAIEDLQEAAQHIVDFEKALLTTSAEIVRVGVSTWSPDSKPYNPSNFMVWDYSGTLGLVAEIGGGPAALDVVWAIKRSAVTGRSGSIYLRNALLMDQVVSPSGKLTFANPVTMSTALAAAVTASDLGNYIGTAAESGLFLCLKGIVGGSGGTVSTLRSVTQLTSLKPTIVPTDHKYYDLPEPTA